MAESTSPRRRRVFREGPLLQVFVAGQLSGDLLRAAFGAAMPGDRFAVLSVIGALGPITPTDLARRLGMAPTTVSTWLGRLEGDRVVKRRRNPEDGRSQLVELTARGREELQAAMPVFRRVAARVRAELGDDLDDVLDRLDQLVAALRAVLAETTTP